jgi:hypothetical protein
MQPCLENEMHYRSTEWMTEPEREDERERTRAEESST